MKGNLAFLVLAKGFSEKFSQLEVVAGLAQELHLLPSLLLLSSPRLRVIIEMLGETYMLAMHGVVILL